MLINRQFEDNIPDTCNKIHLLEWTCGFIFVSLSVLSSLTLVSVILHYIILLYSPWPGAPPLIFRVRSPPAGALRPPLAPGARPSPWPALGTPATEHVFAKQQHHVTLTLQHSYTHSNARKCFLKPVFGARPRSLLPWPWSWPWMLPFVILLIWKTHFNKTKQCNGV